MPTLVVPKIHRSSLLDKLGTSVPLLEGSGIKKQKGWSRIPISLSLDAGDTFMGRAYCNEILHVYPVEGIVLVQLYCQDQVISTNLFFFLMF